MLDITVKTLDGRNRTFSVPDNITVRQFKEKIATSIEIPADTQRLIFQGRVLVDEKEINDYDVNGKTIHVVQKPPPSLAGNSAQAERSGATNRSRPEVQRGDGNSFMLGSFSMPDSADAPSQMRNMVQQMFSGMNDMGGSRGPPTSGHGPSVDVHINIGRGNSSQTEIHNRVNNATQMLASIRRILNRLENNGAEDDSDSSQQFQPSASSSENVGRASGGGPQSASPPTQNLSLSVLSSLLDEVLSMQERLRPHVLRYRQLLNDDQNYVDNSDEMQRVQSLSNLTAEAMHLFGHAYHNVSDLLVDFSSAPPRQLRAQTVPTAAAIVQQTIPVQINVTHVPVSLANLQSTQQMQREQQQQQQQQPTTTASSTTQTPPSYSANAPRPPQGFPGLPPGFPAGFPMGFPPGLPPGFPVSGAFMPPGAAAGANPMPHPGGIPGGFHVFMEMGPGPGGNMSGSGRPPWLPGAGVGVGPQGPVDLSSVFTGASGTPAGAGSGGQRPETGEAAGGSTGGATFPPGEFMQNLIHMATDAVLRAQSAQTSGSQSTAGGSSVDPIQSTAAASSVPVTEPASSGRHTTPAGNSTTATPTHTNQPPPGRPFLPPPLLAGQPDSMFPGAIDPYLPCNSRHFMGHRPPTGAATTTTTAAGQQPTGTQSISQSLAGVVSNIVSSLVHPFAGTAPAGVSPSTSAGATTAASSTSTGSQASTAAGTPQPATGLDVFASMMQGITNELMQTTQGGQSTRSIADFLHQLGSDYDLPQGEGLFTDLFHIIAGQLAFTDLMSVFFGVAAPLERLREPLRQFVAGNILNGSEPTDANIDAAVERLIADMQSDIDTIAGDVQTIDNIDYRETTTSFIRSHLRNVIRLIVNANSAESGFAASLFQFCRSFVHGYIVLSRRCIVGGQAALERHVLDRMRNISADVSPAMQATMSSVAIQQLRQIVPSLTEADVAQYVVYRSATSADTATLTDAPIESLSDSSFESACDGDEMRAATNEDQPTNMDITDADSLTFDAQATSARIDQALLSSVTPPTDVDSDDTDIQVVYGSEDWHTAVPNDWIPVITRDVIQQTRQTSYPPLSDAYLSGMPTKRRRLMTHDRHRDEVADVQAVVFPNMVNRAIENSGVRPTTSQSEVQQDLVNNEQLGTAFRRELNATIQRRLASDSDFVQSKYPNTEKFFNSR